MSTWADVLAATLLAIDCQDTGATTALAGGGTLVGGDNASAKTVADGPRADLPLSLQLNGTDDGIDTTLALTSLGTSCTISAWVNVNTGQSQTVNDNYLFGTQSEAVGFAWGNVLAGFRGAAFGRNSAGTYTSGAGPFTHATNAWHQYACQWDGSNLWTCKDGIRLGSSVALTSLINTSETLRFGYNKAGSFTAGKIAGIRVISGSSEALLAALYAGPTTSGRKQSLVLPIQSKTSYALAL